MADIRDFNFWAVIAYLIPGLLIIEARSVAARGQLAEITKDSLIAFLIVTALYTFVLWMLGIALQTATSIVNLRRGTLVAFFILAPLVLGFAIGFLERRGLVQRLFITLGINVPLPIDTAWMEIFSNMRIGTYLIVLLKDGTVYNAVVTPDSRFGSNPSNPDLFLGQTFHLENWRPYIPPRGVYIRGTEVKAIEIIRGSRLTVLT